jgi:TP901 family phage tail tape measure protein
MAVSNVELRVDARQAVNALRDVNRASGQLDTSIGQLQKSLAGLASGLAGGFAITKAINDYKELDRNIRRLGTAGGDIKKLDEGLGALSQRLGGVASKAELASASYQALSAGFSDTAGNIKLVEAATKAAVGGLADTTQVTEVLTKTLNAYGMSGEKAIKVTDSISKAIEYGQVEWSDYTSQLGRVASIAALAGVSLDEVNAFIAAATKNGATAEVAFTGLSAALTQILQPTKESQDAAKLLGIQWNLAGVQGKGFTGLMAELAKAQNINKEAAARLIGSQEGMRGVFAANAKAGKDYQDILKGLQEAAGKTDSDFNKMKESLENQLKALDTAFKNLSNEVLTTFAPAIGAALQTAIDKLNEAATVMRDFRVGIEVLSGAFGGLGSAIASLDGPLLRSIGRFNELGRNAAFRIMTGIFTAGSSELLLGVAGFGAAKRKRDEKNQPAGPPIPDRLRNAIPDRLRNAGGTGGGNAATKTAANAAERAAKAAAEEQKRVAQVIRDRLAEGQLIQLKSALQDKISAAEIAGDKQLVARLKGQEKELEIQHRYAQALAQEKDIRAQEAIIYLGNTELVANRREIERELTELQNESARNQIAALENQIGLQAELTEQQKQQKAIADSLAGTIGEGMTSAFNALIQGSEDFGSSLRRIASGVLIDIANQLLRVFVIQKAINAISNIFSPAKAAGGFSYSGVTGSALGTSMLSGGFTATPFSTMGLGFRAMGGSVRAGQPYLVGERGPELFMPGRSGGIAPTGSFGGGVNVVVNVDASGSSVQGDDQRANQLGRVVSVAVQQEIVKQKRPGGLLA